jgi:hypothetical protein
MNELSPQTAYIEERIKAGASKQSIVEQLTAVGWTENEAENVYARALMAVGVPVPEGSTAGKHIQKASTVDIILNLFSFILLGVVATALGTLYFGIINKFFPDPLVTSYSYVTASSSSAMHYAIAGLIVAFPLYYFVAYLWFKRFREDSARTESKFTKWLTYLLLLAAAITIVGDLITVLFNFFQGELSPRFYLKAFTILGIAGAIFGYYFLERRTIQYKHPVPRAVFRRFGATLAAFIVAGIFLGFFAAGSPLTERKRGFDDQRASDLASLASCINSYAEQYRTLPASLAELEKTSYSYCSDTKDPETGTAYTYSIRTPLAVTASGLLQGEYQLCATFSLSSEDDTTGTRYYPSGKWYTHGAGYECDSESVSINPKTPSYNYY